MLVEVILARKWNQQRMFECGDYLSNMVFFPHVQVCISAHAAWIICVHNFWVWVQNTYRSDALCLCACVLVCLCACRVVGQVGKWGEICIRTLSHQQLSFTLIKSALPSWRSARCWIDCVYTLLFCMCVRVCACACVCECENVYWPSFTLINPLLPLQSRSAQRCFF